MIPRTILGRTGLEITRLGFGTLPMSYMQKDMTPADGAAVIRSALERGVTFVDTAHSYKTYAHVRKAVEGWPGRVVIATKTQASSYAEAEEHIRYALDGLGVEKLDIMLLHAHRLEEDVFRQKADVWECLREYKARGLIRFIGISTHRVGVVGIAARRDDVDVIHPLINMTGLGLLGGTVAEMTAAIRDAAGRGKGVYAMKALAGGHLIERREEAFRFVLGLPGVHAVAVGMVSQAEVDMNCRIFSGESIPQAERVGTPNTKQLKIVRNHCRGCGACARTCPSGALSIVDGKAAVDPAACVLCGYCSAACPQFAIRMV
ncbi:MAG: aldo/keto reductase [Bacillota bacterium]